MNSASVWLSIIQKQAGWRRGLTLCFASNGVFTARLLSMLSKDSLGSPANAINIYQDLLLPAYVLMSLIHNLNTGLKLWTQSHKVLIHIVGIAFNNCYFSWCTFVNALAMQLSHSLTSGETCSLASQLQQASSQPYANHLTPALPYCARSTNCIRVSLFTW